MTGPQAVILGLVQGVTEFLPISSSAHLILTSYFLGWQDQGLYFDIALHLGSMLAVAIYLRKELALVWRGASRGSASSSDSAIASSLTRALLVGTLPVAAAGLVLRGFVATVGREPALIASTSIVFGVALLVADRRGSHGRGLRTIGIWDGVWIGLGQALALVPGTSRAGITMTVALALGFERAAAARFSFLLAIPVSALIAARQLIEVWGTPPSGVGFGVLVLGFLVSGVAAYGTIGFLIGWVERQDYSIFVAYRVVLGLVILVSLAS